MKSVNLGTLFSTLNCLSGTRMAEEFGGVYWASVPRTHQVVRPKSKKPLPPHRCASPHGSRGRSNLPYSEIWVEGQRGSERGFKSRIVVVRRLRGCGGDWKLKLLACAPKFPPKTTTAVRHQFRTMAQPEIINQTRRDPSTQPRSREAGMEQSR